MLPHSPHLLDYTEISLLPDSDWVCAKDAAGLSLEFIAVTNCAGLRFVL